MENKLDQNEIIGVDKDLSLYDLTTLFYSHYNYHNQDCMIEYNEIYFEDGQVKEKARSLSRFDVLRRIEATNLSSRPFIGGKGVAAHKPNISFGYLRWLLNYLSLPYKSVFSDGEFVKIKINKTLYNKIHLSEKEQDAQKLEGKNNPTVESNLEISDDTSDAFNVIVNVSEELSECHDTMCERVSKDGFAAYVHNPLDWTARPVDALDLVTEPQCKWNPKGWNSFFTLREMNVYEVTQHIKEKTEYWNVEALKWALESSFTSRSLLNNRHYARGSSLESDRVSVENENFSVRSFYNDKNKRLNNLTGYYGRMLVVEGFYINKDRKINHVIFFPSQDFNNIPLEIREKRKVSTAEQDIELQKADVLFYREIDSDDLSKIITIIPANRYELSLERQRMYGHELFNTVETVMRIDSAILNATSMMGVPFIKNPNEGQNAENLQDLEVKVDGEMIDMGSREFLTTPFRVDLNAMLAVRQVVVQFMYSKAYLGGLDGAETASDGRGAGLAHLRLVRDGRIHKHSVMDFIKGVKQFYSKIFRSVLDICQDETRREDDPIVNYLFYSMLTKVHGHPEEIFSFKESDVIKGTHLPYWMRLEPISNGASYFGAAELILYSEIKKVFGDGLDQKATQALNHIGIKSLLGAEDALDILGDPKDNIVTQQDQIYRASLENAAILGSVDEGLVNFERVLILSDKDDHVAHLREVHNPKANDILDKLNNSQVSSENLDEVSTEELETRNNLILKLAALANHIALHQEQLGLFGKKREDINKLKEETNNILQSSEGLLNNLQNTLRALAGKRRDMEMKIQMMNPQTDADKAKQEVEMKKLAVTAENNAAKLALANKLAADRQSQHIDKQLTAARNRRSQEVMKEKEMILRQQEIAASKEVEMQKVKEQSKNKNTGGKE